MLIVTKVNHKVSLVDEMITATVKLYYGSNNKTYLDGVAITVSVRTGSVLLKDETRSFFAFTGLTWTFQLNTPSPSVLTVLADNQINQQTQQIPITAVGESGHTLAGTQRKATYVHSLLFLLSSTHSGSGPVGQVKLGFDLPSLSVEHNKMWVQQLEESIRQWILQVGTIIGKGSEGPGIEKGRRKVGYCSITVDVTVHVELVLSFIISSTFKASCILVTML